MSSKTDKHSKKMAQRRSDKAAKAAKYKALARTSKKTKKIIARSRKRISGNQKHAHVMADCGNPGCQTCNPRPVMHGFSLIGH